MIPAQFDYVAADSAAHAIDLLGRHGDDAWVLAAGHSLLPMMKLRLAAPATDRHNPASGYQGISLDGDEIVIGATTRHADLALSELVRTEAPCSRTRRRWSATRRSGTGAPLAAHCARRPAADLPMASSSSAAPSSAEDLTEPAGSPPMTSSPAFRDRARGGRASRSGCRGSGAIPGATRSSSVAPTTGRSSAPRRSTAESPSRTWDPRRCAPALPSKRSLAAPVRLRPRNWPPKAPRRVKISMRTGNSASTWRGC